MFCPVFDLKLNIPSDVIVGKYIKSDMHFHFKHLKISKHIESVLKHYTVPGKVLVLNIQRYFNFKIVRSRLHLEFDQ